jgi:predicted DNA repair protein MutK
MFLVGGGILAHGFSGLGHWIEQVSLGLGASLQPLLALGMEAGVGMFAGALVLAGVLGIQRLRAR